MKGEYLGQERENVRRKRGWGRKEGKERKWKGEGEDKGEKGEGRKKSERSMEKTESGKG